VANRPRLFYPEAVTAPGAVPLSLVNAAAVLLVVLAATPAHAQQPVAGSALERFFVGRTEGSGTVDILVSGRHKVRDRASGRMDSAGALVLDQIVEEEGKPARRRIWRLIRAGGNRIGGTISDVKGAVAGELTGDTLHLKYRLKEGPSVEQWITLRPGARSATNRMTFHRFGLKVATVESIVRKVD
jgi:hypothetical protein